MRMIIVFKNFNLTRRFRDFSYRDSISHSYYCDITRLGPVAA